jgi:hypothetical protein
VPDDVSRTRPWSTPTSPAPATRSRPDRALGKYLERPVLHYTIGTKVRPSVLKELKEFGVKEVVAHADPPPFEPEMIRGMAPSSTTRTG